MTLLLRFLGLVNSQIPYDIVGVDNFHNMGSSLPYIHKKGFATLGSFETMTSGGFRDDEILASRLTIARTPFKMSPFVKLRGGSR